MPPADVWLDPRVVVRPSPIEGDGWFAGDDMDAGVVVVRFGGRLVDTAELAALFGAGPYVDTISVDEATHLVMPSGTAAHFGNHSCDPNLAHVGPYELATRRAVHTGEELTVDYATHSAAGGLDMACRCAAPRCRGRIRSVPAARR